MIRIIDLLFNYSNRFDYISYISLFKDFNLIREIKYLVISRSNSSSERIKLI